MHALFLGCDASPAAKQAFGYTIELRGLLKMKKPPIIPYLVLVTLFAIGCISSIMIVGDKATALHQPHQLGYPDTGFAPPQPPAAGGHIAQATHRPQRGPALFDLAYEDVVHPDEDLLLRDGAPLDHPSSPTNVHFSVSSKSPV